MFSDSPAPGLHEAIQAVRTVGGVLIPPDAAHVIALAALAAARLPMMAEIYHDLADNDDLNIPQDTRVQMDAIGWHLRNAHEQEDPW